MKNLKISLITLLLAATSLASCKKKGCTDADAVNYNSEAKKDDGTCNFKPAITIVGANPASVNVGAQYSDAGATAFVKNAGAVDVITNLDNVNTSQTGSFDVIYTATNSNGTTTAMRTVNVVLGQSSYLGDYEATSSCGATDFPHVNDPQVLVGANANQLKIDDAFTLIGGTIIMNISGENITVPLTAIELPLGAGALNFSGTGTMNNTGTSMTVTYNWSRTGIITGDGVCTVTYNK